MTRNLQKVLPFMRRFPVSNETSCADTHAEVAVMPVLLVGLFRQAGDENLFGSREIALQTLQARLPGD